MFDDLVNGNDSTFVIVDKNLNEGLSLSNTDENLRDHDNSNSETPCLPLALQEHPDFVRRYFPKLFTIPEEENTTDSEQYECNEDNKVEQESDSGYGNSPTLSPGRNPSVYLNMQEIKISELKNLDNANLTDLILTSFLEFIEYPVEKRDTIIQNFKSSIFSKCLNM